MSRIWTGIQVITTLWAFLSIFYVTLMFFDKVPKIYFEKHHTDSIKPLIYLFPGEKIRLDMDFYDPAPEHVITSARWVITKDGHPSYVDGTKPTIILPPTGGNYQLHVTAKTSDEKTKTGDGIIYVAQDKPIQIKLNKTVQIKLTAQNTNPLLLKDIQSKGIEVYAGNGSWTKTVNVSPTNNGVTFTLQSNEKIALYGDGNQMLFRANNEQDKLSSYGTAHLPNNTKEAEKK